MFTRTLYRRFNHSSAPLRGVQQTFEKGGGQAVTSRSTSSGRAHVVSEPPENEKPYGVPSGVYLSGEPMPGASSVVSSSASHSSTSTSPPHPKLAKDVLEGNLSERNSWPSEKQGKLGREEAWKHRK
ncbi:hypothetical protein RHS03_06160, partial [Rhizoctonia solani]